MKFTIKKFRHVYILPLAVLLFLGFIFLLFKESRNLKVQGVRITNVTSSSATLTWTSDTLDKGIVLYSENDNWLPLLPSINKSRSYDDRDYSDSSKKDETIQNPGDYYTHHVTLLNLEPDKTYFYKITNGTQHADITYPTLQTYKTESEIKNPDPMYGRVLNEEDYTALPKDGIVYYRIKKEDGSISPWSSTYLNNTASWSGDLSLIKNGNGESLIINPQDKIEIQAVSEDGSAESEFSIANHRPLPYLVVSKNILEEASLASGIKGANNQTLPSQPAQETLGPDYWAGAGLYCISNNLYRCSSQTECAVEQMCSDLGCIEEAAGTSDHCGGVTDENWANQTGYYCLQEDLYYCNSQYQCNKNQECSEGCEVAPKGSPDSCKPTGTTPPPAPLPSVPDSQWANQTGYYCIDEDVYYCTAQDQCNKNQECTNGCEIAPQGSPDQCVVDVDEPEEERQCTGTCDAWTFKCADGYEYSESACSVQCGFIDNLQWEVQMAQLCVDEGHVPGPDDGGDTGSTTPEELLAEIETECPFIQIGAVAAYPVTAGFLDYVLDSCKTLPDYLDNGFKWNNEDIIVTFDQLGLSTNGREIAGVFLPTCNPPEPQYISFDVDLIDKYTNNPTNTDWPYAVYIHEFGHLFSFVTFGPDCDTSNRLIVQEGPMSNVYQNIINTEGPVTGYPNTYTDFAQKVIESFAEAFSFFYHPDKDSYRDFMESTYPKNFGFIYTYIESCFKSNPNCEWRALLPQAGSTVASVNTNKVLGTSVENEGETYEDFGLEPPGETTVHELSAENGEYELTINTETEKVRIYSLEEDSGNFKFYKDTNENGKYDEGVDQVINFSEQEISLKKLNDLMPIDLATGWNTVSLPFETNESAQIVKASDLLHKINENGGLALHIAAFRNGAWLIYTERDGISYSNDFNIYPGEGYYAKNYTDVNIALAGTKVSQATLDLQQGLNLINIVSSNRSYTAASLVEEMKAQGIKVSTITKWNAGIYESFINKEGQIFGNDFEITKKESYFILVEEGAKPFTP